ncbi:PaaI family thioesterase [Shimia biformata]|uniref:PaaI family thioesterase n=1 Tax=Shimia biformata TaxID=1294299 RepID=UPI00194EEE51|nr:PaaI family thioesterase [Shimia biformata]
MQAKMTAQEMMAFLDEVFPQVRNDFAIEHMDGQTVKVRLRVADRHLRPGGTVSGPAMFSLADVTAYVATMAPIGREALAVTTGCSIDFMRKPEAGRDLIAEGKVLKLGRALAVIDVLIYSEGKPDPVARSSLTYSIPPARGD